MSMMQWWVTSIFQLFRYVSLHSPFNLFFWLTLQELQEEISKKEEVMSGLDKMATHLKYFSQKQDVVLIKNLLNSVQSLWEKIGAKMRDRVRLLDQGFREAKQFQDSWQELITWLDQNETVLEEDLKTTHTDPDTIKLQIQRHKEFQRMLGTKQLTLDSVNCAGKTLKEKCPKTDLPAIQEMLTTLKNKWNNLCGKSVDRWACWLCSISEQTDSSILFLFKYLYCEGINFLLILNSENTWSE